MRNTIIFSLIWLCPFTNVQSQPPGNLNVLNTSGTSGASGNTFYNYSVGESIAFNNSCLFTLGFVQPSCICIPVSVSEGFDLKYNAKFFPNPTSSQIILETDFADFSNFSITTMDGKIVKIKKFDYGPIDIDDLPPGIYFLRLSTADNRIFKIVKIIKQ